jgi:hypothetical protein
MIGLFSASAQNLEIEAQPAAVVLTHDDLVIVCNVSVNDTDPSQIRKIFSIQLKKNGYNSHLTNVATVSASGVSWEDKDLQDRATVRGSVNLNHTAYLRLTVPRDHVQCPEDFTGYQCGMLAYGSSGFFDQHTNQTFVSYTGK